MKEKIMGIIDIFKPKWRHSKKEIRINAIKEMDDQEKLYKIVSIGNDDDVRIAAINKIKSQDKLEKIISTIKNDDIRLAAVLKITDPFLLNRILKYEFFYSKNKEYLFEAIIAYYLRLNEKNNDLLIYYEMKCKTFESDCSPFLKCLLTKYYSKSIEQYETKRYPRIKRDPFSINPGISGFEIRIRDKKFIETIAKNRIDYKLRYYAISLLNNEEILEYLLINDKSVMVQLEAAMKIYSLNAFEKVSKAISFNFAANTEAIHHEIDKCILSEIIKVIDKIKNGINNNIKYRVSFQLTTKSYCADCGQEWDYLSNKELKTNWMSRCSIHRSFNDRVDVLFDEFLEMRRKGYPGKICVGQI